MNLYFFEKNSLFLLQFFFIYVIILIVMAELVKWLTHWIVVPTYVGSIPTIRPMRVNKPSNGFFFCIKNVNNFKNIFFNSNFTIYLL